MSERLGRMAPPNCADERQHEERRDFWPNDARNVSKVDHLIGPIVEELYREREKTTCASDAAH